MPNCVMELSNENDSDDFSDKFEESPKREEESGILFEIEQQMPLMQFMVTQ